MDWARHGCALPQLDCNQHPVAHSPSARSSFDPSAIGLRAVHNLQLSPRLERLGLLGSRVVRHEVAQEVDIAVMRYPSKLPGGLREPNILLNQGPVRKRDATSQLLF